MKTISTLLFSMLTVALSVAQERSPIIDMHIHAFPAAWSADSTPINHITGRPSVATTGDDVLVQTLNQMKEYNIQLGIVSGPLNSVKDWVISDPHRFIGAPQFPMTHKPNTDIEWYLPSISDIREAIQAGHVGAIGEITSQYAGMVPGDSTLRPFFELAEELDLPVGVHTGRGTIQILSAKDRKRFRVEYGNPKWTNEILAQYPDLRVYLMHAGYPFLDHCSDVSLFKRLCGIIKAQLEYVNAFFPLLSETPNRRRFR